MRRDPFPIRAYCMHVSTIAPLTVNVHFMVIYSVGEYGASCTLPLQRIARHLIFQDTLLPRCGSTSKDCTSKKIPNRGPLGLGLQKQKQRQ